MTDKIIVPMIRNLIVESIAAEICNVQPMQLPSVEIQYRTAIDIHVCDESCETGSWIHSFGRGYHKEDMCPLNKGMPNIQQFTISDGGGNIFALKMQAESGFHYMCEIMNPGIWK